MAHSILKLVSGETIIADVTPSSTPNAIKVSNPMLIRSGIDDDSRLIMSMMRWMETDQEEHTIATDHVIIQASPTKTIVEYYEEVKDNEEMYFEDEDEELTTNFGDYSNSVH